jgi:hypothetical protein
MAARHSRRLVTGPLAATAALALAATSLLVTAGCGDDDDPGDTPTADAAAAAIDATPGAADAAPGADAEPATGGGADPAMINCGDERCPRATEVCCFTGFPSITTTCTAIGACTNLVATCDGPEDCDPGQVCCGDTEGARCTAPGDCSSFPASQLCHDDDDCPEGGNCRDSMFVPWPIC